MKKARKIIPALAMLLVSAIMMSTASFAWFSMNTQVTATGMQVTAKSSGGLVIAANEQEYSVPTDTLFGDSVDLTSGKWTNFGTAAVKNVKIQPTSRSFTDTHVWWHASANSATNGAASTAYTPVAADTNTHYYQTVLYFKSMDETATRDLKLQTISITNNTSSLNESLRVALRVMDGTEETSEGTWFFFAPLKQRANITNKYVSGDTTGAQTAYIESDAIYGYSTVGATVDATTTYNFANVVVDQLTFNTAARVEVYIYFEGEDAACTSQNAQVLNNIGVALGFGI